MPYLINVDNFYGETGSGKTWSLARAAQYFAEKHQKPFRIVFSDTGGNEHIQSFISGGLVDAFVLTKSRKYLLEDMVKLSQGWWPREPDDPASLLVAPQWGGSDNDLRAISGLGFDTATSMCQMQMEFYVQAVSLAAGAEELNFKGVRPPQVPTKSFVRDGEAGGFLMRFSGPSDYGAIQNTIVKMVTDSAALGLPKVIWNAREVLGAELENDSRDSKGAPIKQKRSPIYGPDFIGTALTGQSGGWFGNQIHFDFLSQEREEVITVAGVSTKVKLTRMVPALFTVRHGDPSGRDALNVPHMAKVRIDARLRDKVPAVMEADAYKFYKLLDDLQIEAKKLTTQPLKKEM